MSTYVVAVSIALSESAGRTSCALRNLMLPMFMFSWNAIGIHWARLSKAPQVKMLVCEEEAQGVIDAIMAFAIVNIALTATLLVGTRGEMHLVVTAADNHTVWW